METTHSKETLVAPGDNGSAQDPGGLTVVEIDCDGGCSPNPGWMYGSYRIRCGWWWEARSRIRLGYGTNNRAEYLIMIVAVDRVLELTKMGPGKLKLLVRTDSRNTMYGSRRPTPGKKACPIIAEFGKELREKLGRFKSHSCQWVGRAHMVAIFGH